MHGITTTYRGIRMRSRLEAKWAYFFDRLGWSWQYEPIDFAGWIPDFVVFGAGKYPLVVEVKPLFRWDNAVGDKMLDAIENSTQESDLLVCGADLTRKQVGSNEVLGIGWLYSPSAEWEKTALMHFRSDHNDECWQLYLAEEFEVYAPAQKWCAGVGTIEAYWHDATNAVQWKAAR